MGTSYLDKEFLSKIPVDYDNTAKLIEDIALNKFREANYPDYIEALNKGDEKDYSAMIEIIGNLFPAS
jgi:hypothetical protein